MQIIQKFIIRPYLYIFIALIGISLKFYHIDYKLFWFDEVCTIQHTSGIPDREYPALIPTNEIKYILLLIIMPGFIFFYILDVLRSGMLSWWWRYLIFIAPGVILVMTNFLNKKIEKGNLIYFACFLTLVFIGISSIDSIAEAKHWFIGNKLDVYIEDARLISNSDRSLLITNFTNNKYMVDFMVVMQECNSDNIDILRASPGIENVENRMDHKEYSDIYVFYASDEWIGNLESQFDSQMERLNVEGISSVWKITIEKQQ